VTQVLTDENDNPAEITQQTVEALDGNDIVIVFNVPGSGFNLYNIYGGQGGDFLGMGLDGRIAVFYGGGAKDTLHGGTEGDFLYGNLFDDLLVGGEFDYFVFENTGNIESFGNEPSGDDALNGDEGADALYGLDGSDTLYGGSGDDAGLLDARNANGGETSVLAGLYGGSGADYLDGGRGDDHLDGGSEADILLGGEDDDTLIGGTGIDRMDGGFGNDRIEVDNAADKVVEAVGGGSDWVLAAVSYTLRTGTEVERLSTPGTATTAAINLIGNEFNQRIDGNQAGNRLSGLAGNDTIFGFDGADTLSGGDGKDTLFGGRGNDRFLFDTAPNAATNLDTVRDFANASGNNDVIYLENAVFRALTTTGTLSSAAFKANATGTATDADDRIVYETDTGKLFYDSNGNADGGSIQFATITGNPTLTNADFVVV